MKTVSALAALIGLSITGGTAFAQLATLPADSSTDGVTLQNEGVNAGSTHWDSATGIKAYNVASDGYVPVPGTPDSILGLYWGASLPSGLTAALNTVNTDGGTIRGIYTGESAGWLNDFGYTYHKSPVTDPANSFTVAKGIQTVGSPNISFGQYVDVNLLPGEASTFDFWLNASGRFSNGDTVLSAAGVYTAFDATNSDPYLQQGNVRWTQSPIELNTWVAADNKYEDVSTYLVSFEDWRLNAQDDADFSDFILAVQLYDANGTPLGGNPVPEASTYGLFGAAGLLGLAALRRRKAAQAKA